MRRPVRQCEYTCMPIRALTHSLTYSPTHSLTHLLTHSLTHSLGILFMLLWADLYATVSIDPYATVSRPVSRIESVVSVAQGSTSYNTRQQIAQLGRQRLMTPQHAKRLPKPTIWCSFLLVATTMTSIGYMAVSNQV